MMSDGTSWAVLYGTIVPAFVCSTVFVTRVCTRALLVKTWAWDDSLAYMSWLALVVTTIVTCISSSYGLGLDMQDIQKASRPALIKLELTSQVAYQLCLSLIKFSVLLYYRRTFYRRLEQIATLVTIIIAAIATPTFVILYLLQCSPSTESSVLSGNVACFQSIPIHIISSVYHILLSSALIMIAVPTALRAVWSMTQKLQIFTLTMIGGFGIAASIIRLYVFVHYVNYVDPSWNSAQFAIWTVVECAAATLCANLVCCSRKWEATIEETEQDLREVHEKSSDMQKNAWAADMLDEKYHEHIEAYDVGFRQVCWGRPRDPHAV